MICRTCFVFLAGLVTASAMSGQVVLNEFLASNSNGVEDPDFGNSGDWVELHNTSDSDIELAGWFLTDDLSIPNKWSIPSDVIVPAGGHLIIWCDGQDVALEALHTNFKLIGGGEEIALHQPDLSLVDAFQFQAQTTNISQGRNVDGSSTWGWFESPTPGESNNASQPYLGVTLGVPSFSEQGGFKSNGFNLTMSSLGGNIHFTTDGRAPTWMDPVYTQPIPSGSNPALA